MNRKQFGLCVTLADPSAAVVEKLSAMGFALQRDSNKVSVYVLRTNSFCDIRSIDVRVQREVINAVCGAQVYYFARVNISPQRLDRGDHRIPAWKYFVESTSVEIVRTRSRSGEHCEVVVWGSVGGYREVFRAFKSILSSGSDLYQYLESS